MIKEMLRDMTDSELENSLRVLSEIGMMACDTLLDADRIGLKQNEVTFLEEFVENTITAVDAVHNEIIIRVLNRANQAVNN